MKRKLFCEISPLTYQISLYKGRVFRHMRDFIFHTNFATEKRTDGLPVVVYAQKTLMRRRLGNVDMRLQDNKVINLNLAVPKVNGIIIKPGEIFSFWKLVGSCSAKKGYREGLVISGGRTGTGKSAV